MNSTERQKQLLQQEIAKLSGAISRHATSGPIASSSSSSSSTYPSRSHSSYHPYRPPRGTGYRGAARGRGRGGIQNGSTSLDLRAVNKAANMSRTDSKEPNVAVSDQKLGNEEVKEKEEGEVSRSPTPAPAPPVLQPVLVSTVFKGKTKDPGWVKSSRGNMSLMTEEKRKELASRSRERRLLPPPQIQMLSSTSTSTGTQQVVIDGVVFQFEPGGKKLTRIGEAEAQSSTLTSTPTRKKLKWAGQSYRRTSAGNLISSPSRSRQKEAGREYCRYFTKTGRCNRANTCTYKHDPLRLAICPLFLRQRCPHPAGSCRLSHTPSSHNTPSCVHFQATSTCRNPTCIYPHVRVSPSAEVCEEFAREGWCDQPPGSCPKAHVWECQEWRERGSCSRGNKCGLRHVLRAESNVKEAKEYGLKEDQVVSSIRGLPEEGVSAGMSIGGFDDGASWIGVPSLAGEWEGDVDQGSPARVSGSESAEDGSDSESGDEGEEGESESEEEEEEEVYEGDRTRASIPEQARSDSIQVDKEISDDDSTDSAQEEEEVLGVVL